MFRKASENRIQRYPFLRDFKLQAREQWNLYQTGKGMGFYVG